MTACWGHMGVVWGAGKGRPTAIVYVRPNRYTKEFMDREGAFTLSVLGNEYKKQMAYLGTHSGRNEDKIEVTGLTPVFDDDTAFFEEAKLVVVCKTIYRAPLVEEGFIDNTLVSENYPKKDFHDMYIGEIIDVFVQK